MARVAVSKKTRFEVFKRDGFVCQYCGSHPPAAVLECDHIKPVASGGGNEIDNLITACSSCNSGKGARHLSSLPQTVVEKGSILIEREEQLEAYNELLRLKREREDEDIEALEDMFRERFKMVFSESFCESIRRNFLPKLDREQLETAMYKACWKCREANPAIKYFCGICWRLIKGDDGR